MLNIPSTVAQTRLISLSLTKESKTKQPRLMHYPSAFGFICPSTTSDGAATGISNSMTIFCQMSSHPQDNQILVKLLRYMLGGLLSTTGKIIYINGQYFGQTSDPKACVESIRECRRSHLIAKDVSVYFNTASDSVLIRSDGGRFLKPCFVASNMSKLPGLLAKYHKDRQNLYMLLFKHGLIEFLDPSEAFFGASVAPSLHDMRSHHTHSHLHSIAIFAGLAAIIPYSNHNAGARNIYWAGSQCKALLSSVDEREQKHLSLTQSYSLMYPQSPLVRTFYDELVNTGYASTIGFNVVLAISTDRSGTNIEDSIVFNRASIQRGLGMYKKTIPIKIKVFEEDIVVKPDVDTTINLKISQQTSRHIR